MFSKIIRTIYLYLVCLISLFMIVGGFISCVDNISDILFPSNYYSSYTYDKDDDFSYRESEIERQEEIKREKNRNIKSVINSLSFVVVGIPLYVYNWKKIEKEKEYMNIINDSNKSSEKEGE